MDHQYILEKNEGQESKTGLFLEWTPVEVGVDIRKE
jgi:hypothetical protein